MRAAAKRRLQSPASTEPRRVLVVVDDACTSPSLCRKVRAHVGAEQLDVFVIAPAHGVATQWYVDEAAARADATGRLRACVACLRDQGLRIKGELTDPDPVQAIADTLEVFPAEQILIITAPQRPSAWLHRGVIERARRAFSQPIEHIVMPGLSGRPAT